MTRLLNSVEILFNGKLKKMLNGVKMSAAVLVLSSSAIMHSESSQAATGEEVFNKMCMSCHSTTDKVLMGPGLQGIADRRDEAWVLKWVKDPQGVINSGDEYAVKLFNDFNKIPMPGFPQLTDDEIKGILAFVKSKEQAPATAAAGGAAAGTASAATPSASSGATTTWPNGATPWPINTSFVWWTVISLTVVGLLLYRFNKKTVKNVQEAGYHSEPHAIPNYPFYFFVFMAAALLIAYWLIAMLQNNIGLIDTMMFMVLPYLAFGILLVGSIYRYINRGHQVSSLSSQFLEGRKLFWGSQPFHWGLVILFTGHLISFLFPRAVLAWNGEPVRLLILEFTSFAFGLSALLGLILLVKRRLASKTLLVVTNKMDMVVYTVLFMQIISGLGVAFFVRWGSSWFSSALTPYLRSIFSFDPDIAAVSEMPWLIQFHIVSAFAIIAIIPFTRFVHFLVAPIDYLWRKYQLVIWNWNPKNIRMSTKYNFGKKPRNH